MSKRAGVSNRQRVCAREPVLVWRENDIAVVNFTTNFCENGIVIKNNSPKLRRSQSSFRNHERASVAIIIKNNCHEFVAHKL